MQNQGRLVEKEPWRVNRQALGGNRQEAQEEETARMMEIVPFPFFMAEKAGVSWWFHFFFVPLHTNYARAVRAHVRFKD